jgi:hypothetical protein
MLSLLTFGTVFHLRVCLQFLTPPAGRFESRLQNCPETGKLELRAGMNVGVASRLAGHRHLAGDVRVRPADR